MWQTLRLAPIWRKALELRHFCWGLGSGVGIATLRPWLSTKRSLRLGMPIELSQHAAQQMAGPQVSCSISMPWRQQSCEESSLVALNMDLPDIKMDDAAQEKM